MKYRIIDKLRRDKKSLEGLAPLLKDTGRSDTVEIKNWNGWKTSFWTKIKKYGDSIVIDSGVIEELAKEIRRIKTHKQKI